MKILLAAIDKVSNQSLEMQMFAQYAKRLPWKIDVKELDLKKQLPAAERKAQEGALLLGAAEKYHRIIALDPKGKSLPSEAFAAQIGAWQQQGHSSAAFLIGGADGLSEEVLQRSHLVLSLGSLTWPHLLVRAMLAEQIYRAYTILTNHPYHRA